MLNLSVDFMLHVTHAMQNSYSAIYALFMAQALQNTASNAFNLCGANFAKSICCCLCYGRTLHISIAGFELQARQNKGEGAYTLFNQQNCMV